MSNACLPNSTSTGTSPCFAAVVGVWDIASGNEDEKIGPVLHERAVLEGLAPPADGEGAQEEEFEAGGKGGIALVDGVLTVAQQMGEAELALNAMPVLSGIARSATQTSGTAPWRKSITTLAARLSWAFSPRTCPVAIT